jgi:hypothetical protein
VSCVCDERVQRTVRVELSTCGAQATLEETFLKDLDELGDGDDE